MATPISLSNIKTETPPKAPAPVKAMSLMLGEGGVPDIGTDPNEAVSAFFWFPSPGAEVLKTTTNRGAHFWMVLFCKTEPVLIREMALYEIFGRVWRLRIFGFLGLVLSKVGSKAASIN